MVRRLVENQHVGLLQHDLAEEQPRSLAAGERVGLLEAFLALEEHLAENSPDVFLDGLGVVLVQPILGCHAQLDRALVILRKVADLGFVTPFDAA